jgi:sarcosine oxidase subunit beta
MATADIVVIGGGVTGASTAFHLAALGAGKVVLVERRQLGAGASGKSGSLVRTHYTNPVESRLAHESLKVFQDFKHVVGGDPGFEPVGFLQIVGPGYEAALAHNVAAQRALGINTRLVSREEVRALAPACRVDDIGGAAYEPESGFADPNATTYAFAAAAERLGAEVRTRCEASRIRREQGRVSGVDTTGGSIDTRTVVLAPGAWGAPLLGSLHLDYGLTPHRVQISIFRWPAGFAHRHPAIIDAGLRAWLRPEGDSSTLIGVERPVTAADPETFDEGVDPDYVRLCQERLGARLPALADATMRGGWAGMVMMSGDGRPIIDQVPSVPGLYVMLGDSGTSFKTAPAIGRCLAEWVVHGQPRLMDLAPFRSTRFAEGRPWVDAHHYGGREGLTISR